MKEKFVHQELRIVDPKWDSKLTDIILKLEELRYKTLSGTVPSLVFFQLKIIFQFLESFGSAKIEGNNTTISELIDSKIANSAKLTEDERMIEIENNENAMKFIDENIKKGSKITKALIFELQKIIVKNLKREGDINSGNYKDKENEIQNSQHITPMMVKTPEYMDNLINFMNQEKTQKYDLLIMAISHHRFVWIHPFNNGNGRVVRALTYAMLVKQGFNVKFGRILNPTAIFCNDRNKYYSMLSKADTGTDEGILSWCEYVLKGLLKEIQKIDKLTDLEYLLNSILIPSLDDSFEKNAINEREYKILKLVLSKKDFEIKTSDIIPIVGNVSAVQRSRIIKKMKIKQFLIPTKKNSRKYTISFTNNALLRSIIKALRNQDFIGFKEEF